MSLYLIRHGETEWSLSGRHTGLSDIPLTARGEQMALELGPRLANIPFIRVLTSPLQRARRTCELAGIGPAPEVDPDLCEWDYGDHDGLTGREIRERNPGWSVFRDGARGGETPEQLAARADAVISRLRLLAGSAGNVAIFSHGHFLRVLAVRWIGLPVVEARRFLLDTASVCILGCDHNNIEEPAIRLWNSPSGGTL